MDKNKAIEELKEGINKKVDEEIVADMNSPLKPSLDREALYEKEEERASASLN